MTPRTNEHLVVLPNGGQVIRVRTVKRKPYNVRWQDEATRDIKVTPRMPNHGDKEVKHKEDEVKVDIGGEGKDLPQVPVEEANFKARDFKITKVLLGEYGYTQGCLGCDQAQNGRRVTGHSKACRARLEVRCKKMMKDR